jgi:hypothetical protein
VEAKTQARIGALDGQTPLPISRDNAVAGQLYGSTRKGTLLESVPFGVSTWTFPLVAPVGTVVVISEGESTLSRAEPIR